MIRLAAGAMSGLLLYLSMPPMGWWWAAPLGVALFVASVSGVPARRAAAVGTAGGLGFFLPLFHWLTVLGNDAWLLLVVAISLWFAGLGWVVNVLRGRPLWVITVPAAWVLQEALRSRVPWGGLGWGRLAFGQDDSPLTGWVTLGGAALLSFVVALLGCLLLMMWTSTTRIEWVAPLVTSALLVFVGNSIYPTTTASQEPASAQLAVVQGGVPQPGIDFNARRLAVLRNHALTTVALAKSAQSGAEPVPDGVIWPENSSDLDPVVFREAGGVVSWAADTVDRPILVGAVQEVPGRPDRIANVGLVWEPQTGPSDVYIKQHPVPFGEFLPFRPVLERLITRFDRVPRDFIAGERTGVLQLGPARVGDVICFEISDDGIVRDAVRAGGRAVVVQTNNATYAATDQPEQQLAISRLRARETGRSVLVAATTGITAIISPDGRASRLPELEPGWINEPVALADSWTPAVRFGAVVELGLCAVAAMGLITAAISRRRTGSYH